MDYTPISLDELDRVTGMAANQTALDTPKKSTFKLRTTTDILEPRVLRYLVDDLITMPSVIGVYGSTGHGKSFVVVDIACHIASGKPFNGYAVKQGGVLYVAAEDSGGIERRIAAWMKTNPTYSLNDSLHLIAEPCLLPSQTSDLIECMANVPNLRLLILDTLNMTMEGNENDTTDMTAYMRAAKAIGQAFPDLCVLIVHHAGKSGQEFARGSVAFKANLDVEFCVRMDSGIVTISNTKVKNSVEAKPLAFSFSTVELDNWTKETGEAIESAVLVATDAPITSKVLKVTGTNQQKAITVLMALTQYQQNNLKDAGYEGSAGVLYTDWERDCIRQGIARKPSGFKERILLKLQESEIVKLEAPYIRLLE
jgi:DNA-binding protein Fis